MKRSEIVKKIKSKIRNQLLIEQKSEEIEKLPDSLKNLFQEVFEDNNDLIESLYEVRQEGRNTQVIFEEVVFERNIMLSIVQNIDFEKFVFESENEQIVFIFSII